uniref:Alginate export domain-containing protein n=1 Tax=Candidatus Kentrum sp. TC TaxID=2126339 RepID=A0A450YVP3_9GAMM|nr:MAG: hypothetical protein BECKTC1821D_GA0114238_10265 [Candidatus Kentron sp. TC]
MNTIRRSRLATLLTFVTMQTMAAGAQATETESLGHMEAEIRWFPSSSPPPPPISGSKQKKSGAVLSVALKPEWKYLTKDRRHDFKIAPFVRYDAKDKERTHVDMRELYWTYKGDGWKLLTGINQVFWGVTESHHLVDIINQTDLIEDPDGEDKLGQPMIQLTLALSRILEQEKTKRNWGKMTAFLMPGFRERTYPGPKGRLGGPFMVDTKAATFRGGAGKDRIDLALRYSHSIGKWDIGLHYFHGNSREPRLTPRLTSRGLRLAPEYDLINQVGADIQYTDDAWLWKFEGIVREGHGDTFGALVAGLEYTFFQPFKTWDVGLLAEYLHDDRDQNRAPKTIADNDIFLGTRLSFNDVQNTQLLAGIVSDLDTDAYTFNLEAERRLTNNISAELFARLFDGGDASSGNMLPGIEKDDYIQLSVFYHF